MSAGDAAGTARDPAPALARWMIGALGARSVQVLRMEKLGGGDGILLDDVVAGVYGLVLVMVPARLLLPNLPWLAGAN